MFSTLQYCPASSQAKLPPSPAGLPLCSTTPKSFQLLLALCHPAPCLLPGEPCVTTGQGPRVSWAGERNFTKKLWGLSRGCQVFWSFIFCYCFGLVLGFVVVCWLVGWLSVCLFYFFVFCFCQLSASFPGERDTRM